MMRVTSSRVRTTLPSMRLRTWPTHCSIPHRFDAPSTLSKTKSWSDRKKTPHFSSHDVRFSKTVVRGRHERVPREPAAAASLSPFAIAGVLAVLLARRLVAFSVGARGACTGACGDSRGGGER